MRRLPTTAVADASITGSCPGEIVQVFTDSRGTPKSLLWNYNTYHVSKIKATWLIDGRWWLDPARIGIRRRYYRLSIHCRSHRIHVEIYQQNDYWRLWRIID